MGVEAKVAREVAAPGTPTTARRSARASDNAREFLQREPGAGASRSRTRCARRSASRCCRAPTRRRSAGQAEGRQGLSRRRRKRVQRRRSKARALQLLAQRDQSRLELRRKLLRHARAMRAERAGRVARPRTTTRRRRDAAAVSGRGRRAARLARGERLSLRRALRRVARPCARRRASASCASAASSRQHAVALPPELAAGARRVRARARARPCARAASPRCPPMPRSERAQSRFLLGRGFSPELVQRLMRRPRRAPTSPTRAKALPAPTDAGARSSRAARRRRRAVHRAARGTGSRATFPGDFPGVRPRRVHLLRHRSADASMKIHEYQGKEILRQFGVPVPRGIPAFSVDEAVEAAQKLGGPVWVVKAQIHAGGRGKGGGVKLARSIDEVAQLAGQILGMQLDTHQTGPRRPEGAPPADRGRRRHQEGALRRRWSPTASRRASC